MGAAAMVEVWRGGRLESLHQGHAVVCGPGGEIVHAWGDPAAVIFPRSSCKMVQALPLVESGAATAAGLTDKQLALACASHAGAAIHTGMVTGWLDGLGLGEADLRCGSHWPEDAPARDALIKTDCAPCQIHNNCSGKHTGFLTLNRHLKGGAEYVEPSHPVQLAVRAAVDETTCETSPGYGIDGCSAPNFATSVAGFARAMAFFAGANPDGSLRERAAARLTRAMAAYPELVAGEGCCDTELMRAMHHKVAMKAGAEGVFVAILPEKKRGVALKIIDGSGRGREAAMAGLLVKLGVLEAAHPATRRYVNAVQRNWRGLETGVVRLAPGFG